MSFIVKAPAFLDEHGRPVMHRNQAHRFEDRELAKAAAELAKGEVYEVHVVDPKPKPKPKPVKKNKPNQSWMKGLKK